MVTTGIAVGVLTVALALSACTTQHPQPKAGGPTTSAHPSSSTTSKPIHLSVKGVPVLIDRKGSGNSDLIVLPYSGPLSMKVTCTELSTVQFLMKPELNATVTCDPNDTVVSYPDKIIANGHDPLQIKATPITHWTVSVGLATTV